MKTIVDEMPKNPKECRYSEFRQNAYGASWYGCCKSSIACEDTSKCPHFISLRDALEKMSKGDNKNDH